MLHTGGKGPSDAFMTHCHRQFFHAQWKELLDDEFLEAYEHGVVIECCDGVKRRFYIRIFAYSADYPEKFVCYCYQKNMFLIIYNPEFSSPAFVTWVDVHVRDASFQKTVPIC